MSVSEVRGSRDCEDLTSDRIPPNTPTEEILTLQGLLVPKLQLRRHELNDEVHILVHPRHILRTELVVRDKVRLSHAASDRKSMQGETGNGLFADMNASVKGKRVTV